MVSKSFVLTMKFFPDTRTRRNTAFVVMLMWLFALVSSVANACLLEPYEPLSRAAKNSAETTSQVPTELLVQIGTDAGHRDNSEGTNGACLKVCDDGSNTLPKAYAGVDLTDPGPALLIATLWAGAGNVVPVPHRMDDLAIPLVGPPLRVRYSRLAL